MCCKTCFMYHAEYQRLKWLYVFFLEYPNKISNHLFGLLKIMSLLWQQLRKKICN